MKKRKYWAGFCDGQICWILHHYEGQFDHDVMPAIYKRRKDARKHYQDVRPVEIKEIRRPKK